MEDIKDSTLDCTVLSASKAFSESHLRCLRRLMSLALPPPGWAGAIRKLFWTLWCKERLTEARQTPTIQQGATPSGLRTYQHLRPPSPYWPPQPFYGPFSRTTWVSRCQKRNFWTLWCKGRLTEADTPTIRLGATATPSGLTSTHLNNPPIFYRPDALPTAQPTVSKHWRPSTNPSKNVKMVQACFRKGWEWLGEECMYYKVEDVESFTHWLTARNAVMLTTLHQHAVSRFVLGRV